MTICDRSAGPGRIRAKAVGLPVTHSSRMPNGSGASASARSGAHHAVLTRLGRTGRRLARGPRVRARPRPPALPLVGAAEDEAFAIGGRLAAPDAGPLLRLAVCGDDARRGGSGGLDVVLAPWLAAVECPGPAGRDR